MIDTISLHALGDNLEGIVIVRDNNRRVDICYLSVVLKGLETIAQASVQNVILVTKVAAAEYQAAITILAHELLP